MDMSVSPNPSASTARQLEQPAEPPFVGHADMNRLSTGNIDEPALSIDAETVKQAVSEIQKYLSENQRNLQFSTDEESGRLVVKVIATDTGELIRQLPSEEALRIARSLDDMNSFLFDAKA